MKSPGLDEAVGRSLHVAACGDAEGAGLKDDAAFAQALQEIARAVGDSAEVDAVCAAVVVSMVRCAEVSRAEIYLREEGDDLRRVASSSAGGQATSGGIELSSDEGLQHALATGQRQLGSTCGFGASASIFAALPLTAQRRVAGVLVLHKERGSSFSTRELDLWSAAAGLLAVAVENARLLREARAALRIRDEFMSIASHELKTPLTPLKMSLYTMERRIAQGKPVELSSVIRSKRQVDRLAGLVNDLLDASCLETGKLTVNRLPLELRHLVMQVVEEFRGAFDRRFDVSLPEERLWVMGDRDRLEQVLVNLLENAQKYSPAHEPIRIEVECSDSEARVRVMDRGIGIPAPEHALVFQRFYRARNAAHRNFGGLGLGLFISRSIINLHGGELELQSHEGQGTTFTLRLPRMSTREVYRLPKRVLVLEEDAAQRNVAWTLLHEDGFEVIAVNGPAEALAKLAQEPVDLMVISSEVASRPGGSFFEALHSSPTARPVPMLFGGDVVPSWASGAARCCRPYDPEELAAAVRASLGMPRSDGERTYPPLPPG